MSDGKIEQVPDKKGSHERVTGHALSVDTGRTVVPSAIGTTRGAQLGRDHTVAAPSTMVMPDGSKVPVVPPAPVTPAPVAYAPPGSPPVYPEGYGPGHVVSPAEALLGEEAAVPTPAPAPLPPPPGVLAPVREAAFEAPPPIVSITLKSLPDDPVIRWRARYHEIIVTPTTVVLVWDSRFKHADSPLLPVDTGDLTKLKMEVRPAAKNELPFSLDIADCGLSFVHGSYEYFVFVRDLDRAKAGAGAPETGEPG